MKVVVIPADENLPIMITEVDLAKGLGPIRDIIDGYVEAIPVQSDRRVIICADEDGKTEGKPINGRATKISDMGNDFIVGDVVVCGTGFKDVEKAIPDIIDVIERWSQKEEQL